MAVDASGILVGNPATSRGATSGENQYRLKRVTIDEIYSQGCDAAYFSYMCDANSKKMSTKGVSNVIKQMNFRVLEDDVLPHRIEVSGAHSDSTTTINVDSGKAFPVQGIIRNERTGEQLLVKSIATNALTVVREYGTTAAAAMLDNDTLRIIGVGMSETSKPIPSIQTRVTSRDNMMQLFGRPIDLSKVRDHTSNYGKSEQMRQEHNTRWNFLRDVEQAFMFGEMVDDRQGDGDVKDSSLTDRRCLTGGFTWYIEQFASQNIFDFNGHASFDDLMDILYQLNRDKPSGGKRYPSHSKMTQKRNYQDHKMTALCGHKVVSAFAKLIQRSLETTMMQHEYGFVVTRIRTPYGTLDLFWHRWLDGPYEDNMLIVEPTRVFSKTHEGFDYGIEDVTPKDQPRRITKELSAIKGFAMANPSFHGWARGITSIS